MKIWVDGDGCPTVIKEILFKAAQRTRIPLTLVANRAVKIPNSSHISFIRVGAGLDVADSEIVRQMDRGDLVITGDIPLAALVVEKGGLALGHRGQLHTAEEIRSRLSVRDFMQELRDSGVDTGGPAALSGADRQSFSNQLDRLLTKYGRKR